jgi:energy-coupling factor transporter ATP-binding protein EcfA2
MNPEISYFATTNARQPHRPFGIYQADRMQHVYVLGKTGTGKSTLLETLFMQDVQHGRGCILLDPHGDLADRISKQIPASQAHRLYLVDLASEGLGIGYNPLKGVVREFIPLAVSGLLETFQHHFGAKAWGPRMEHIFRNVLYALLETGEHDLTDVLRMLSEREFRLGIAGRVSNPQVRYFFEHEFARLWGAPLFDAIAPIQSKVGAFLTDPKLRAFLVDFSEPISFRKAMDEGQVVIVNLARGVLGADTSNLLASLLLQTITLAALSRQSLLEAKRRPCHLYLDEFEHFLTPGTAGMLSEVRKVGLSVTLANQYLYQLTEPVKAAVMGNVGTIIAFRVGPEDARMLARHFYGIDEIDLQNLPNHHLFVRMMIEGEPSRGFSATGLKCASIG